MIQLRSLTKMYKFDTTVVKAVDNANFQINDRDFVIIRGRSGSGKTTLLSLIAGITKPTAGIVSVDGIDIWSLDDNKMSQLRNEKIGLIFQFPSLINNLNVRDNVFLPATFNRKKMSKERAHDLLTMLELSEKITAYPPQLSIGQQKRVAIVRSLITDPEIILADEPTGDLDEELELKIMELFCMINKRGTTIVVVTHNSELLKYGNRVFRMTNGTLIEN